MSYMKRFLEDVMEEMGADEITDEVLAEAQRRLDLAEVNRKFQEAAAEDKKRGYGGEQVPRSRLFHANQVLQEIANRKAGPSTEEILAAEPPVDENEKIRMGQTCSHCHGQKRTADSFGRWNSCSKCGGEGVEYYTMTRKQLRAEGLEVCPRCGDIYHVEDYCRQCELRAMEGRLGVR